MNSLSSILRGDADHLSFWCPGCDTSHTIRISGTAPWGYNGDPASPTFTPSVKVTWPANPKAAPGFEEWLTERVCHSFVNSGQIQFLSDCTHTMAGQTVPLPPFPEDWAS